MKMKKLLTLTAALCLTAGMAQAAHIWEDSGAWWDTHWRAYDPNSGPLFTSQELSLDLFGSYYNPEGQFNELFETSIKHGWWGGGAGLNYFITREIGLETDFNMSAHGGKIVDYWVGNVVLRLPIGNSGLAPYAMGGGGRMIGNEATGQEWQWMYGGGVGLEMRFNPVTAIFSDARFYWGDKGTEFNRLVIRGGLRLVF